MSPLALTDSQMKIVRHSASALRPEWRERYLADIADQLAALPDPADQDVQAAVAAALNKFPSIGGAR